MRILILLFLLCSCGKEKEYEPLNLEVMLEEKEDNQSIQEVEDSGQVFVDDALKDTVILSKIGPRKNGVIVEWYENGIKKSETTFVNGVKNGYSYSWFPNGQLKRECWYMDDRMHNSFRSWYENGKLKVVGNYFKGQQEGEWILFNADGKSLPSIYYKNGKEVTRDLPALRK